ncbi:MAG: CBS domain-containing protein [Archaeoglobaceae archaeon]|nr:CBS domain-containing protein [Archaeoglobaceae archaeon]MCX8151654.1 CBS domain-containing protein [Archaeoglobaceae archaeon]MDW8013068.1 CBS domain-containing protein [Archaeoglobaceae archaeon]
MKASEIMNPNVKFATLPGTRERVLQLFKEHGISAVPVVKDGKVVGIVTRKDILRKIDERQLALLMTPNPVCVEENTPLKDVVKVLTTTPFRRLPVVKKGELVGIITVMDIIKKIAEMNIEKPIRDYITPSIVCVWEMTPLNVVGEIMRLSNSELCGVLDDEDRLVGIVDEKIMLTETLIEEFIEQTKYSSSSNTDDEWSWDGLRDHFVKYFEVSVVKLPKEPVKNFMKKPEFVYPQTSVSKCAKKMIANDLDHVPVLDSLNRVAGLVKDKDLIKVLLEV